MGRPKRQLREFQPAEMKYGRVMFTDTGRPIGFEPMNGVAYRIRDFEVVSRLHERGEVSEADMERVRRWHRAQQ